MGKGRAPCCDKSKVKKGPWSPQEDLRLITFIQQNGHTNWRSLPKEARLARCGKSCRLRWINYLRPDLKRGNFTIEEEETIIKLHRDLGNKWSQIASCLPGRTDNEIKNVWHTHLKKMLNKTSERINHHKDDTGDFTNSASISHSSSSSSISILSPARNQNTESELEEKKQENDALDENSSTSNSLSETNHCSNSGKIDVDCKQKEDADFLVNNAYEKSYGMFPHPDQDIQNYPLEIDSEFWEMLDKEDPICTYQLQTNEFEICQSNFEEESEKENECMRWMKILEQELLVETSGEEDQNISEDICRQFLSSPSHFN